MIVEEVKLLERRSTITFLCAEEEKRREEKGELKIMENKGEGTEAQKYIWEGAIPLQIHLHESEVTTLPTPPPAMVLLFPILTMLSIALLLPLIHRFRFDECACVFFLNQFFDFLNIQC